MKATLKSNNNIASKIIINAMKIGKLLCIIIWIINKTMITKMTDNVGLPVQDLISLFSV